MKVWRFNGPNGGAYAYVRVPFWRVGWFRRNVLPRHAGMREAERWMPGPRSFGAQFILRPKPPNSSGVTEAVLVGRASSHEAAPADADQVLQRDGTVAPADLRKARQALHPQLVPTIPADVDPMHPQFIAGFKYGHALGRQRGIAAATRATNEGHKQ